MAGLCYNRRASNSSYKYRNSTNGKSRKRFGLIALFSAVATNQLKLLVHIPRLFTAKILAYINSLVSKYNSNLNKFHPLSVFHVKSDNKLSNIKESNSHLDKLDLFKEIER